MAKDFTFTKKSGLVKLWTRNVREDKYTFNEVPELYNLREMVAAVLAEDKK